MARTLETALTFGQIIVQNLVIQWVKAQNQLSQQRRTFSQWQTSPQTQEMERLRDYLNTQDAKTRLREIKAKARERSRQQKPSREIGSGLSL